MNLSAWMARLENMTDTALALETVTDLPLFVAVTAMSERHGETPGAYLANACRRFAAKASEEDWLALMTAMERAEDPSGVALERMLRWALAQDEVEAFPADEKKACSCEGCSGGCRDGA